MSRDPKIGPSPGVPEEPEEIEILDVVGFDEERAPSASRPWEIEVTFEAPPEGEAAESPEAEVESLRERILRIQADFENLKRRVERERDEHTVYATGTLVARLLPVLDSLERAMEVGRRSAGNDGLVEGLAMVRRQLLEELRREGLQPLAALGRAFDPKLHEAVATERDSALPPGWVVAELRRGYLFHDRLLRPALVRVNLLHETGAGAEEPREEGS